MICDGIKGRNSFSACISCYEQSRSNGPLKGNVCVIQRRCCRCRHRSHTQRIFCQFKLFFLSILLLLLNKMTVIFVVVIRFECNVIGALSVASAYDSMLSTTIHEILYVHTMCVSLIQHSYYSTQFSLEFEFIQNMKEYKKNLYQLETQRENINIFLIAQIHFNILCAHMNNFSHSNRISFDANRCYDYFFDQSLK